MHDDRLEDRLWTYVFTGIALSTVWAYASISIANEYPPAPFWAFLGGVGMAMLMSAIWPPLWAYAILWYAPYLIWYEEAPPWLQVAALALLAASLGVGWLLGRGMTRLLNSHDASLPASQERPDKG